MAGTWNDYAATDGPWNDYKRKPKADAKPRTVGEKLSLGARDALSGLASVGDLGVYIANAPAVVGHALSGTPYTPPTPFGDIATRVSNALGFATPIDDTERLISGISRGAASAIPFIASGGAMAAAPVAQVVSGAGAGGASELTRQAGGGELAQLVAGLLGGIVAPVGLAAAGAAGRAAVARATGNAASAAERIAARRSTEAATNPARAVERIDKYGRSSVEGVFPTTLEATGDPGLIALARSLHNTAPGAERIWQIAGENTLARADAIDRAFGAGSVEDLTGAAQYQADTLGDNVSRAVRGVGDIVPPEVAGEQARTALEAQKETVRRQASALYDNIPDGDAPLQVGTIDPYAGADALPQPARDVSGRVSIEDAAEKERAYWQEAFDRNGLDPENMKPDDWDALYRDVSELPPHEVTFTEMDANARQSDRKAVLSPFQSGMLELRRRFNQGPLGSDRASNLTRQIVNAYVMSSQEVETIARQFRDLAHDVGASTTEGAYALAANDALQGFLRSKASPERLAALKRAADAWHAYKTTYAAKGSPVTKALQSDYGRFVQPDATLGATLVPRNRTGAEIGAKVQTAMGADAAETLARSELRRAVESAGNDKGKLERVAADYADTLRAYPALQGDVQRAVESAALADAFKRSPMGRLAAEHVDADKVIASLLRDGNFGPFKGVVARANTPSAMAGLRRAMANFIANASERGGGAIAAESDAGLSEVQHIGNMRKAVERVLRATEGTAALDGPQRAALNQISAELGRANAAVRLNAVKGSNTSRDVSTAARAGAIAIDEAIKATPGGSVLRVLSSLRTWRNGNRATAILVKALEDPAAARVLLSKATPAKASSILQIISPAVAASGSPVSTVAANDIGAIGAAAAAQGQNEQSQK